MLESFGKVQNSNTKEICLCYRTLSNPDPINGVLPSNLDFIQIHSKAMKVLLRVNYIPYDVFRILLWRHLHTESDLTNLEIEPVVKIVKVS